MSTDSAVVSLDAAFAALPTDMDRRRWLARMVKESECPTCKRKGEPMHIWRNGFVSCEEQDTCLRLHSDAYVAARDAARAQGG